MKPLTHDQILELYGAVVSAGLTGSRAALLVGMPAQVVAALPVASTIGEQILADLDRLNGMGRLIDGTIPVEIWLKNAATLAMTRREAAVFERALQRALPHRLAPAASVPDGVAWSAAVGNRRVGVLALADAFVGLALWLFTYGIRPWLDEASPGDGIQTASVGLLALVSTAATLRPVWTLSDSKVGAQGLGCSAIVLLIIGIGLTMKALDSVKYSFGHRDLTGGGLLVAMGAAFFLLGLSLRRRYRPGSGGTR